MLQPSRRLLLATAATCLGLYAVFSLVVATRALDASDVAVYNWVNRNAGETFLGVRWSDWTLVGAGTIATIAVGLAAFLAWRAGAARTAVVIVAFALLGGLLVTGFKDLHDRPYPGRGAVAGTSGNRTACAELTRCDIILERNATVYCAPGSRCDFHFGNETERFNSSYIPADISLFPDRPGRAYPSGHTMGATASWGVVLLLGTRALQRQRGFDPWAVALWAGIAFIGGISRMPVGAHWWTDVVGAWLLGGAVVACAILADDWWTDRRGAEETGPPDGMPPAGP